MLLLVLVKLRSAKFVIYTRKAPVIKYFDAGLS